MHETAWPQPHRFIQKYNLIFSSPCLTAKGFCAQYRKLFLYFFGFPFREDDFVDKEEDQHQNVTVEHRGSDVIDKVRHQQAHNRRSHAVDEVNESGDQTECQHQAICLARSTSCAGSGIGFLFKAGKTVGFEPKTAAAILPV